MSDYMIEPGSFEARVREEVLRILRDPLSLPPAFRSWLVPFIESSNVQIPILQIVGNFLVAEHVNELGGSVHGRPGVVRVGPAPYNFIGLTYDGASGKWISDPIPVLTQRSVADPTSSTSYADSAETSAPLLSWREWVDAGLTLIFRYAAADSDDERGSHCEEHASVHAVRDELGGGHAG